MLEHSIYSVISPEGCASILWRSRDYANDAATALKLTAQDLFELKLIDGIIEEPVGGAHRRREDVFKSVSDQIEKSIQELTPWNKDQLIQARHKKFLDYGRKL